MNEIQLLKDRVEKLETLLAQKGGSFEELIRDIVFYDVDGSTSATEVINVTGGGGGTVTSGKIPTKFVRAYFRGQPYNIAVYAIT